MKKLITVLLALAMVASLSVTAFAADVTTNGGQGSAEIGFGVDPTYTVTIPATVTLEKKDVEGVITYENDYTIEAAAGVRLKKNEYIEVAVTTDNEMETPEGATLAYTITKDDAALENNVVATFTTDKAAQTSTIHIAAGDPDFAGDYKDTVTFTLTVKTN